MYAQLNSKAQPLMQSFTIMKSSLLPGVEQAKLRDRLARLDILAWANRALIIAATIITAVCLFTVFRGERFLVPSSSESGVWEEQLDAVGASSLKQSAYAESILNRDMFGATKAEKLEKVIDAMPLMQLGLKLVGILSSSKDAYQAMIEDSDGQTYLSSEGDVILKNITVESISVNKVVVSRDGEVFEIK